MGVPCLHTYAWCDVAGYRSEDPSTYDAERRPPQRRRQDPEVGQCSPPEEEGGQVGDQALPCNS